MRGLKTAARSILSIVPAKRAILRAGGYLPPAVRSRASYRLLSALARVASRDDSMARTNLGISRRFTCDVPSGHVLARFGTPALYAGERGSLELARTLASDADAFVDIGAHIGVFTFYVRSHAPADVPVYFFEPDSALFAALSRNVSANHLGNVIGFNEAVGAADGAGVFYVNETDSFSGSLHGDFDASHRVRPAPVSIASFASVAKRLNLSRACVKVDVEGAERAFVDGAAESLQRIAFLVMEVLGPAAQSGFVAELMRRGQFHAYYINDYDLEPSADGSFTYREPNYNWLFCRHAPDALAARLASTRLRVRR